MRRIRASGCATRQARRPLSRATTAHRRKPIGLGLTPLPPYEISSVGTKTGKDRPVACRSCRRRRHLGSRARLTTRWLHDRAELIDQEAAVAISHWRDAATPPPRSTCACALRSTPSSRPASTSTCTPSTDLRAQLRGDPPRRAQRGRGSRRRAPRPAPGPTARGAERRLRPHLQAVLPPPRQPPRTSPRPCHPRRTYGGADRRPTPNSGASSPLGSTNASVKLRVRGQQPRRHQPAGDPTGAAPRARLDLAPALTLWLSSRTSCGCWPSAVWRAVSGKERIASRLSRWGLSLGLRGGPVTLVGAFELEFDGGAFGVAGFGDDHFGEAGLGVLVVAVGAVQQQDGVGVLFEGAGVAEV